MNIITENSSVSLYNISKDDYEISQQWDRSNHNKLKKNELLIDHCTFLICDGVYLLIAHGTPSGEIQFNNELIKINEIEEHIRIEQSLPATKDIFIRLVGCYDGYVGKSYLSEHCWIQNSFNTHDLVNYDFFKSDNKYYANFINLAKMKNIM